ncbi:MAG: KH domain-containing protein [Candidatus Woesebacteria bacterium]
MKSLLEFLLIHLVTNPDAVSVEVQEDGDTQVYLLHVDPVDVGRIIGKNGKIIDAVRMLARVRAVKEGTHILVRVAEPEEALPVAPAL